MDEIKPVGEKVLVFCVQKKLQEALSHHLGLMYGLNVPIINGDTRATPRNDSEETRLALIEQFSRREGFGICVLSPIAAGAGLNIVAAITSSTSNAIGIRLRKIRRPIVPIELARPAQ